MSGLFGLDDYIKTAKLSAIFRLANALDKSHKEKIKDVDINITDSTVCVTCQSLYDITIEKQTFTQHVPFFEEVFGLHALIKHNKKG